MLTSKLKLNPDKTEFIVFGLKRERDNLTAYYSIDILGSPLCPVESVKNLASALVSSQLDYCNSLFRSLSKLNVCKLLCIQNCAARIVSNTSRLTIMTPVPMKLHWDINQFLKRQHFFTSILTLVFPGISLYISLSTTVLILPGTVRVVVISLSFLCSTLLCINLSNCLCK